MNFAIRTHSRDDLIFVGNTLGQIFKDSDRARPWMMTMNKDNKSGKSLVASAIDQIYDPSFYPAGITKEDFSDILVYIKPKGPVAFLNLGDVYPTKSLMDERLNQLQENFPAARVIISSNMERSLSGEFNYQTHGLNSDLLDLNIDFHVESQPFGRRLEITAEDPYLCDSIRRKILFPA